MRANEYYDSIAEGYDELYASEQNKKLEIVKKEIKINKHTKILDIGCGSGESSNFECNIIGIDPSAKLIEIAKKKYSFQNHPNKEFIVSKAEQLSDIGFKDKEFDYVICVSAIHHIENLKMVLKEIIRIGKKYVFTILNRSDKKQKIINTIEEYFTISKKKEEDKDIILFCDEKRTIKKNN